MESAARIASIISASCAVFMLLWNVVMPFVRSKITGIQTRESLAQPWWKRPITVMALLVIFAWIPVAATWLRGNVPPSQSEDRARTVQQPPALPRSKQTINELLDESGAIQKVVNGGIGLINEWREMITTQNPERVCLDLDSRALQDKITAHANKLSTANREISAVLEKNTIDAPEFRKMFREDGGGPSGFEYAAQFLRNYAHEINLLGEHPTCENVIRIGSVPNMYYRMVEGLNQFSIWEAQSQERLSRYRDDLRLELRSAP